MPDPIFLWNLKVSPQIIRGLDPGGYDEFRNAIIANQINWVFISPAKGTKQEEIILELIKGIDPVCSAFSKGALVKVDSLWRVPCLTEISNDKSTVMPKQEEPKFQCNQKSD